MRPTDDNQTSQIFLAPFVPAIRNKRWNLHILKTPVRFPDSPPASPQMVLGDPVQSLVEGSRGEVAAPVVVVAVRVGEEVSAEHGEAARAARLALPHRAEVVRQRAELRLRIAPTDSR